MPTLAKTAVQSRAIVASPRSPPRILVATAGDDDSAGALWLAADLAKHRAATIMALGVAVPFPHTFPTLFNLKSPLVIDEDSRRHMLDAVRTRLSSVPGTEQWNKSAVVGWPADTVNEAADAWRASLIVIGLGRHGRANRLFGTETAIAVMKHAKRPVLAVSVGARSLPRNACVAVDFTPASIAAARVAASLLSSDGTLSLVHACAFKGANSKPGDLVDLYRAGARAKLDAAATEVRRYTRRRVRTAMIDGEPAATILAFAHRERCDLIALGGHEQGLVDRILLGSVRTRVLRSAKCSVLIAPPRDEA